MGEGEGVASRGTVGVSWVLWIPQYERLGFLKVDEFFVASKDN